MTEVIYLKSFEHHEYKEDVVEKVNRAIPFFPEIDVVYVGITRNKQCVAQANTDNNIVMLRPDILLSNVTIFHELMHIVANLKDETPKTEEYCSIYAMARMTKDLVDRNIPYVGSGNRDLCQVPAICRNVVKYRESGHKNYIKFYKGLTGLYPERYSEFLDEETKIILGILDKQKDSYS